MIASLVTNTSKPTRLPWTSHPNTGAGLNELVRFSAAPNGLVDLAACLSNLFISFEILSSDPANLPMRRCVARCAGDVAAQLNQAVARLDGVKKDLHAAIQKETTRANDNLKRIADLNRRILAAQASGKPAALLVDQREEHLQALADRVTLTAISRTTGRLTVKIGGVTLISGANRPDRLALTRDKDGRTHLFAHRAGQRLKLIGGTLAGTIAARDQNVTKLQNGLNNLAAQLIVRVNAIYAIRESGRPLFIGTDAASIGVNTNIDRVPARWQSAGLKPRRRTHGVRFDQELTELNWYQHARQAFAAMTAKLNKMTPL